MPQPVEATGATGQQETNSGISVANVLGVTASAPLGGDPSSKCKITAVMAASNHLEMELPRLMSALPRGCTSGDLPSFSHNAGTPTFTFTNTPYHCVNFVVGKIAFHPGCGTAWTDGGYDGTNDDYVLATAQLSIIKAADVVVTSDGLCSYGDDESRLSKSVEIKVVGKPQLKLSGQAIQADCVHGGENARANACGAEQTIAVVSADVVTTVNQCGAEPIPPTCADLPHPEGAERLFPDGLMYTNCCDHPSPYPAGPAYHCDFLVSFGLTCNTDQPVDMSSMCPDFCQDVNPSTGLTCGETLAQTAGLDPAYRTLTDDGLDGRGNTGSFELIVDFDETGDEASSVTTTVSKTGFLDTIVVTDLLNDMIDIGAIYMVPCLDPLTCLDMPGPADIVGACLDKFTTPPIHQRFAASLFSGMVLSSVLPSVPLATTSTNTDGEYSFSSVAAGMYTVVCTSGDFRGRAFVVSNGDYTPPEFMPVAVPAVVSTGFLVTAHWQTLGKNPLAPDLDLHAIFPVASQSSSCDVFFGSTACGGSDFILDGPSASLQAEAIQINTVYPLIYTFYIHYPEDGTRLKEYIEVRTAIYGPSGELAEISGTFEVNIEGGNEGNFMRLFCVDATSGVPEVHEALLVTATPPTECSSCPC
jgi:hypothetical protein